MTSTSTKGGEFRRQLTCLLPRLSRFAMALTRSRADADDLIQAACERALSRIDQWSADTRLDSWMFRIMQTIWFNEVRARGVRKRHRELTSPQQEAASWGERDMESRLLVREVEARIASLPAEQRALLVLVCVDGFTYKEAAEVLSIPVGTVMSRLARARLALMEHLEAADTSGDNIVKLVAKCQS